MNCIQHSYSIHAKLSTPLSFASNKLLYLAFVLSNKYLEGFANLGPGYLQYSL